MFRLRDHRDHSLKHRPDLERHDHLLNHNDSTVSLFSISFSTLSYLASMLVCVTTAIMACTVVSFIGFVPVQQ